MLRARVSGGERRRPMLLALVFGVVLVLVGVTASALVAVASDHLSRATLSGVVKRDASLVELFVNGELRAGDLASGDLGTLGVDLVGGIGVWTVPAATLGVPGILLLLWIGLQTLGAIVWVPAVRRLHGDREG